MIYIYSSFVKSEIILEAEEEVVVYLNIYANYICAKLLDHK
jgi:hypothetical protein